MAGDGPRALLRSVGNYRGLSALGEGELKVLCREMRELIIDITLKNGGHLGGSLGAVELCVALLRAFNPERDKIVFDVGHQTYAYKILTDRLDRFHTLRTRGGISGFPRRGESRFDAFDVGHSSTSISAALGFAKARDIIGRGHEVVAVIGDGALLNGLAFEALNNISSSDTKLTVILNDNKMSISPRVGGMAEHLAKLSVSVPYKNLKQFVKDQCRAMSSGFMEEKLGRLKTKLKSLLLPTNIFEAIGLSYWGPFDGHNVVEMEEIFELSKQYPRSLLIHVVTRKGKGCAEAEEKPASFHGVGSGTVIGVEALPKAVPNDWSQAVSELLIYLAEADPRVVVCTAAMAEGSRLGPFSEQFPGRFFDVGIAEGHMLTFAAGLAAGGMRPVVCIYSTFLQRAADQLVHDVCLQKHPVLVAVDRSGLNGEDGETHQGLLDIAWGKSVPGLVIGAPRDKIDLCFMISGWLEREAPVMIRFPKGKAPDSVSRGQGFYGAPAPWGAAEILRAGTDLCLVGVGCAVEIVLEAAEELSRGLRASGADFTTPTVADLRFAAPIDWRTMDELIESHSLLVVAEDGYLCGGVGEEIAARAAAAGCRCRVLTVGVKNVFVAHATRAEQMRDHGLTASGVVETIDAFLEDCCREDILSESGEAGEADKFVREYRDGNEEFDAEASG
ncbi:MAG: 1-deoxy-D-xylulose-5-phosphate synthase [Synergistaceae bacterium]|jgi:1-deoxy-D-xylulose-5-phosphate synthase|nr:1-deoxy-D-xylulose-5-phosphate synthase [Synergistaceae bacterium]